MLRLCGQIHRGRRAQGRARVGGAEISRKHAGFIVNAGGATSGDVLALAEKAKKDVLARFGVELESEIIYVE